MSDKCCFFPWSVYIMSGKCYPTFWTWTLHARRSILMFFYLKASSVWHIDMFINILMILCVTVVNKKICFQIWWFKTRKLVQNICVRLCLPNSVCYAMFMVKGIRAHSTFHLNAGMEFELKDQPPVYHTLFVPRKVVLLMMAWTAV